MYKAHGFSPCGWAPLGQVDGKRFSAEVNLVLCVVQKPPALTPLSVLVPWVLWCVGLPSAWLLQTHFLQAVPELTPHRICLHWKWILEQCQPKKLLSFTLSDLKKGELALLARYNQTRSGTAMNLCSHRASSGWQGLNVTTGASQSQG